jgi:hypothetical protein
VRLSDRSRDASAYTREDAPDKAVPPVGVCGRYTRARWGGWFGPHSWNLGVGRIPTPGPVRHVYPYQFYFLLFSLFSPFRNLNLNSNLISSFCGSSLQFFVVKLEVLIWRHLSIYIIYLFISFFLSFSPHF